MKKYYLQRVPNVYLGFYSGTLFGIFLSFFMIVLPLSSELLNSVLGLLVGIILVLAFFSHFIRRRYNLVCGCTASSYCASDDEE
ncbi:MAG: hypothetical protein D3906_00565 [Candidatus Electrothrix sp. AUS1_2]|nr:hypothetical protein [Candidatus Electrothrix sp. AUS1_2]